MYLIAVSSIVVMTFYYYLKPIFSLLPFLKDMLVIGAIVAVILSIIAKRGIIIKPNIIDKMVIFLLLYLFFEIIYTSFVISKKPISLAHLGAAYYGFRLHFLPILLYFIFKNITNRNYVLKLDKLIITSLAIGIIVTILEYTTNRLGLLSLEQLLNYLNMYTPAMLQNYTDVGVWGDRVIGIAGSPHITGVYNVMLFSMLLYSFNIPSCRYYNYDLNPFVKFKSMRIRKILLFTSFIAVFISSSKTAWSIMLIIILLNSFSSGKLDIKFFLKAIVILFSSIAFLITFFAYDIVYSYIGYLFRYLEDVQRVSYQVLANSPIIGFGFEVGAYSQLLDFSEIRPENITISTELFWVQILRMLGIIGLGLYLLLFIFSPLKFILSKKMGGLIKIYAISILAIGIGFFHYSPLTSMPVSLCAWFFIARISTEYSLTKSMSNGNPIKYLDNGNMKPLAV
jgi:hypothetical protein